MLKVLKTTFKPILVGIMLGFIFSGALLIWKQSALKIDISEFIPHSQSITPVSPLSTKYQTRKEQPTLTKKDSVLSAQNPKQMTNIIGFLPYWKLGQVQIQFDRLNSIAFFGIPIDKYGRIAKLDADGNENPGWTKFKSKEFDNLVTNAHQNETKIILVLEIMDNNDITAVLNNPLARQNTRENILALVQQKGLDGINIDVEYQGIPDTTIINNFTLFIQEFRDFISRSQINIPLSLDVHADSVVKTRLFELGKIHPYLDQIIIMGYDFFRPNSANSGPIAPLNGKEKFEYDITTTINDFIKVVPAQKLILGIPFYGYEWETETAQPFSKTIPNSGALATYGRIQKLISDQRLTPKLDELSQSPYLIFEKDGVIHQIFYEDVYSLTKKIDLVKNSKLSGIAIWAVGYEGDYPGIWQAIK